MRVLLLSTYELGHQPLAVARPAAHLSAAGHQVRCQDLAIQTLDLVLVRQARLVGISVPMHTATRLGVRLAERVRALNPDAHICFYGLYAALHADVLLERWANSVIGGEFESSLVDLANHLGRGLSPASAHAGPVEALQTDSVEASGEGSSASSPLILSPSKDRPQAAEGAVLSASLEGVITRDSSGGVFLGRQSFLLLRRDLLPPLKRYARVDDGQQFKVVGYVEASRGCVHRCRHCPITPVYRGRLRVVPRDAVLDDIRQLVAMGAEHITFGDPDFFNGVRHSVRILEAMHAQFPGLTFDATIKIEHLLEHRQSLPALKAAGCLFIVSAAEAVQDHILANFQKGHTAADVQQALALAAEAAIPLRLTFVPFTPWTSLEDYLGLLDFVAQHGLVRHVDPVQFAIRLLVPRGSSLIGTPAMEPFLGPFDEVSFCHRWLHPDPRVDRLQEAVSAVVEQAVRAEEDAETIFGRVCKAAGAAAGRPVAPVRRDGPGGLAPVPRLTEPWFC